MRPGPPRVVSLTYASVDVRPVPDCTMISDLVAVTVAVGLWYCHPTTVVRNRSYGPSMHNPENVRASLMPTLIWRR